MSELFFTLEFDDESANSWANDLLEKGWKLLHVGTKLTSILDSGQAYYCTVYVLGATKDQYEAYKLAESEVEEL